MTLHRVGRPAPAVHPSPPLVRWQHDPAGGGRRIVYTGPLAARPDLRLHYALDGWSGPVRELAFDDVTVEPAAGTGAGQGDRRDAVSASAAAPDLDGHLVLDFVVRSGGSWDNNHGSDYRLWTTLDPVDSHLHARQAGTGPLGTESLRAALASAGIRRGVVSWRSNTFITKVLSQMPDLVGLVWVRPHQPIPLVRHLLRQGRVGLKLHPNVDGYDADDHRLDRLLRLAARHRVPVAVHSAPGHGDPDRIRRLAERHPAVPVVLYHTYLGPSEGRRRAVAHALAVPNLVLETSWCRADEVHWIVEQVGPDRVVFGSDAAVDGPRHYTEQIVENTESYTHGMLELARRLGPTDARTVLEGTTCRLFGLDPSRDRLARP